MTAPKLPEGFIEWRGGMCPVELSQRVVAIRRDGDDTGACRAYTLQWSQDSDNPRASDIVAYKVVEEAKPAPTGHPHAELMAQYAEDARTTPAPWTLWEWRDEAAPWREFRSGHNPSWHVNVQYRRKPVPKVCECCGQEIKQ